MALSSSSLVLTTLMKEEEQEVKRKRTYHSHTVSTLTLQEKTKSKHIKGIKLDLAKIQKKHARNGLRNIYANKPPHCHFLSAETEPVTSRGENRPRSILRKTTKDLTKEIRYLSSTSLRDFKSVKFDIKSNQVNTLNDTKDKIKKDKDADNKDKQTKCKCIIY